MNEFEEAMQDVLDYGKIVIDNLTPEQIKMISHIFEEDN